MAIVLRPKRALAVVAAEVRSPLHRIQSCTVHCMCRTVSPSSPLLVHSCARPSGSRSSSSEAAVLSVLRVHGVKKSFRAVRHCCELVYDT